jgi:hypothetical protein
MLSSLKQRGKYNFPGVSTLGLPIWAFQYIYIVLDGFVRAFRFYVCSVHQAAAFRSSMLSCEELMSKIKTGVARNSRI